MGATGKAYLIGAGPGDPPPLTLGALWRLQQTEVILYSTTQLVAPAILALAAGLTGGLDRKVHHRRSAHSEREPCRYRRARPATG